MAYLNLLNEAKTKVVADYPNAEFFVSDCPISETEMHQFGDITQFRFAFVDMDDYSTVMIKWVEGQWSEVHSVIDPWTWSQIFSLPVGFGIDAAINYAKAALGVPGLSFTWFVLRKPFFSNITEPSYMFKCPEPALGKYVFVGAVTTNVTTMNIV